ncbi:MAG: preprotein translocase subunit SecE [Ekhidna sp.]|nr:preprotein translocase subunit SecE [Ekhidna sp.]
MSKVITFFKDSYEELSQKVTWPKYGELQNSAILVLVASLIFALVIGAIDYAFENLMEFIYQEF